MFQEITSDWSNLFSGANSGFSKFHLCLSKLMKKKNIYIYKQIVLMPIFKVIKCPLKDQITNLMYKCKNGESCKYLLDL